MKKLLILMLLIFVSCSDVNSNSSAQETTSTTSLFDKQKLDCITWVEKTNFTIADINYLLDSFFSAVGRGDLTSSWFEEFQPQDKISNLSVSQIGLTDETGQVMMRRQIIDVGNAITTYREAFKYWEQGILEDDLKVFNQGTNYYEQAESILDNYKMTYLNYSNEEEYYYEFSQYCLISG